MGATKNAANLTPSERARLDKEKAQNFKSPDLKNKYILRMKPRATYYFDTEEKRDYFIENNITVGEKYTLIHQGKKVDAVRTEQPVVEE